MSRRITQTVTVLPFLEGGEDRYGNPVTGWGPPVLWGVWAVAPRESVEPDERGRTAVITGKTVYGPLPCPVGPHDRVVLADGGTYEVEGEVGVWDHNPHGGNQRGVVVNLERSEG